MLRLALAVFLTTVYLLILSPVAFLMRQSGRNPLTRGTNDAEGTYWRNVIIDSADVESYKRPY